MKHLLVTTMLVGMALFAAPEAQATKCGMVLVDTAYVTTCGGGSCTTTTYYYYIFVCTDGYRPYYNDPNPNDNIIYEEPPPSYMFDACWDCLHESYGTISDATCCRDLGCQLGSGAVSWVEDRNMATCTTVSVGPGQTNCLGPICGNMN